MVTLWSSSLSCRASAVPTLPPPTRMIFITSPFSFRVPSAGTAQIHHSIPYLLPKFHCFPHYATKTCQMTQKAPGETVPEAFISFNSAPRRPSLQGHTPAGLPPASQGRIQGRCGTRRRQLQTYRCAVEGSQTLALLYVVAALFMQGDAGGKIQRVALFLSARTQQHAGRANLLASFATM